jgi:adenylylsulfate kinase
MVYGVGMSGAAPRSQHVTWHAGRVTRADREALHGHRGVALWLTGLSGAGKSTLARGIEEALLRRGVNVYVLDGDNVRHGLSGDLGFSPQDRTENLRRIGEVSKLFVDAGVVVVCAFVSPSRLDRERLRATLGEGDFVEAYVHASLDTCRQRDPKGLYGKADSGEIDDLTGVGAPYEPPERPDLVLDTELRSPADNVALAVQFLSDRSYLSAREARS